MGLAIVDEELYAVGGYNDIDCKYLKTVEKYDPKSNSWSKVKSLSVARRSPGIVNYRDKLYVVGGMGTEDDLKTIEVFDPLNGTWTKFPHPLAEICGKQRLSIGMFQFFNFHERNSKIFHFELEKISRMRILYFSAHTPA